MDHFAACRRAAAALEAADLAPADILVGFDGFVDAIIDVVDKRLDAASYRALPDIPAFAERVAAAAGRSANLELVVTQTKIGGNGPIMANALLGFGATVEYIGIVGDGAVHPVFTPLAAGARRVVCLGQPAWTDALEFGDGKLMLGKLTPLDAISYDRLVAAVGVDGLRRALASVGAVATVNWTMTLAMTDIWRRLASELLPGLRRDRPRWFVDLADPAKRTATDLAEALATLTRLQEHVDVVLGMNGSEGRQVLANLGRNWHGGDEDVDAARRCAEEVREQLGIATAMVHLVGSAACADRGASAAAAGFRCAKPRITTGAGDHFNAGFLVALVAGLEQEDCLLIGGATSGHYVRTAQSPDRHAVAAFLHSFAESMGQG